jgi:hypothetical protein
MTGSETLLVNDTRVRTTREIPEVAETYTEEGKKKRKWGVKGRIISFSDAHGLSYEVTHDDGTTGCYDPGELEVIT